MGWNQRGILFVTGIPTFRPGRADGSVEISVSDAGIEISPEDQAKMFEEFHQVERLRS